ncbi:MAG: hypothetical protein R3E95_18290 [Thiolinea sp.]
MGTNYDASSAYASIICHSLAESFMPVNNDPCFQNGDELPAFPMMSSHLRSDQDSDLTRD